MSGEGRATDIGSKTSMRQLVTATDDEIAVSQWVGIAERSFSPVKLLG